MCGNLSQQPQETNTLILEEGIADLLGGTVLNSRFGGHYPGEGAKVRSKTMPETWMGPVVFGKFLVSNGDERGEGMGSGNCVSKKSEGPFCAIMAS